MTSINAEKNEVTVGVKSELYEQEFFVSGASWYLEPESPFEAEIQIRYRHEAVMGEIERLEGGRAAVRMNVPQTAVTPGQAAVFYRDDCIIGGGWIE